MLLAFLPVVVSATRRGLGGPQTNPAAAQRHEASHYPRHAFSLVLLACTLLLFILMIVNVLEKRLLVCNLVLFILLEVPVSLFENELVPK